MIGSSVGVTYNVVVTNEHECLTIHEGIIDTQEQREMRILGRPYTSIDYGVDPPVDHPYINDS